MYQLRCYFPKIILIFLFICTLGVQTKRVATFRNISNHWSHNYFSNFTTFLKNNSIYGDMITIKELNDGFKGHIEFQIRAKGSKAYQTLFSYTLDICHIVTTLKDNIFKKWFQSVLKYGNFMQNCPVAPGHYYMNGWKLDLNLIPSFLYTGDYRVTGHGFYGKLKSKLEDFVVSVALELTIN